MVRPSACHRCLAWRRPGRGPGPGRWLVWKTRCSKSIATTMHGTKLTDSQIADLTAYLETLAPPPRRDHGTGDTVFAGGDHAGGRFSRSGSVQRATPRPNTRRRAGTTSG